MHTMKQECRFNEYGDSAFMHYTCGCGFKQVHPCDNRPSSWCPDTYFWKEWDGGKTVVHIFLMEMEDEAMIVYQDGVSHTVSIRYAKEHATIVDRWQPLATTRMGR